MASSGAGVTFGAPFDYPSLTTKGSGELYYGVAVRNNSGDVSGGGTTGFVYTATGQPLGDLLAYDTNASGTVEPVAANTDGGSVQDVVGVLITAGGAGASAAISVVGSAAEATGGTLSVSPAPLGDLMVLSVSTNSNPAPTVTSVSGGGVSTWSLAKRETDNSYAFADDEIWTGVVTATGAATITVDISGFSNDTDLDAQEFSAGAGATWSVAGSGAGVTFGSPLDYPTLSASGPGELYYGVAVRNNAGTLSGGATSGFTYTATGQPNGDFLAYDTDASGTVAPAAANSDPGSVQDVVGVLITAWPISAVGTTAEATGSTLSVSPQTVGDLMVLSVSTNSNPAPTVTAVSGGGVSTWALAKLETDNTSGFADVEIWTGLVTATGSSTITVAISGYSNGTDLDAQEFSAGGGGGLERDQLRRGDNLGVTI